MCDYTELDSKGNFKWCGNMSHRPNRLTINWDHIKTREQRMSKFKEPNFLQALIIFALIIITLDIVEDWILYLITLN